MEGRACELCFEWWVRARPPGKMLAAGADGAWWANGKLWSRRGDSYLGQKSIREVRDKTGAQFWKDRLRSLALIL